MKTILISLKILLILTIITGVAYPLLMTGIIQLIFPGKANGSLIIRDNKVVGSTLIGQNFDSTAYFWPRPSAIGYNPLPSGGSNYGPTSEKLKLQVAEREKKFTEANGLSSGTTVPSEMVFASASGLDPHISPEAARLQVNRIIKARNFSIDQKKNLQNIIEKLTERPQFQLLGQERINVFLLNLELDKIK